MNTMALRRWLSREELLERFPDPKGEGPCVNFRCPIRDDCCVVRSTDCLSYREPVR